jgi:hypothetical protein
VADLQDTPVRAVEFAPFGVFTATDFHAVPFHASATGAELPELLLTFDPTARHAFGEPHEILLPMPKMVPVMAPGTRTPEGVATAPAVAAA